MQYFSNSGTPRCCQSRYYNWKISHLKGFNTILCVYIQRGDRTTVQWWTRQRFYSWPVSMGKDLQLVPASTLSMTLPWRAHITLQLHSLTLILWVVHLILQGFSWEPQVQLQWSSRIMKVNKPKNMLQFTSMVALIRCAI